MFLKARKGCSHVSAVVLMLVRLSFVPFNIAFESSEVVSFIIKDSRNINQKMK